MAQVLSVDSNRPTADDRFLVDTNVWLLLLSPRVEALRKRSAARYSGFLQRCRDVGAVLCYTPLTLAEIATVVERQAVELVIGRRATGEDIKNARRNAEQRARICDEIFRVYAELEGLAAIASTQHDVEAADTLKSLLRTTILDANDALFVHAYRCCGLNGVVTDDADFASVGANLIVFTANQNIL